MRQTFPDHCANPVSFTPLSSRLAPFPDRRASWLLAWLVIGFCGLGPNPNCALAGGTVTNCDQASLEAALAGGGNVSFACSGVIVLTNTLRITTDTVLDGTGQSVAISGNDSVRIFSVQGNVSLTLMNLTLTRGKDVGAPGNFQPGGNGTGGAVFVDGGILNAINCQFATNQTVGGRGTGASGTNVAVSGSAYGGAIYLHAGNLSVTNSSFVSNEAIGGEAFFEDLHGNRAGHGLGGAIYSESGVVRLVRVNLINNSASSGFNSSFSSPGSAWGGAIYATNGMLELRDCNLSTNSTVLWTPGPPYPGGAAGGGALYLEGGTSTLVSTLFSFNQSAGAPSARFFGGFGTEGDGGAIFNLGQLLITNCTFLTNTVTGGSGRQDSTPGAKPGNGGALCNFATATVVGTTFVGNKAFGGAGDNFITYATPGGSGNGAAIYSTGTLALANCTLLSNDALGGNGSTFITLTSGGSGHGGALFVSSGSVAASNLTLAMNSARGGTGGVSSSGNASEGSGFGGAVFVATGTVALVNCTLFQNVALGGDGVYATSGGSGYGGAVFVSSGSVAATNLTFAVNSTRGGKGGPGPFGKESDGSGFGATVFVATGAVAKAVNTILATSLSASNCVGTLTDGGHNISSDASCNFSSPGSLNSTDPKLGPFGDYGGPTATIPLLSGSPAIDAGDSAACPAVDQRGISKPYGAGCDIGAFESAPPYTVNGHIRGYLSPQGVVVNVDSNSVPVNASAFYTLTGLDPGTHLVIPTASETRFVPARRVVQMGPDGIGIDFNAYRLNALEVETSTNRDYQIVFAPAIEGTYHTEVSTNLVDWSLYSTNTADTNGVFVIADFYSGSGNATFFRVVKP
jgi:hypothetical protein